VKKEFIKKIIIPFLALLACTFLLESVDADIRVASFFYEPEKGGWFLGTRNPWRFLYDHANKPGLLMVLSAIMVFAAGWVFKGPAKFRKESLFLFLFLAIGPGLVVNVVFKDHWGRPRPHEIVNFGGSQQYLPAWQKGVGARNGSFPSGHASIGFYLMAPYFFLRRKHKHIAFLFLAGGLSAGSVVGAARIVQGGHFLTDVIWAGGMTYLTGEILAEMFNFDGKTVEGGLLSSHEQKKAAKEEITHGNQQDAENVA
jgi:membrane-associated PAP2 superfamily phosphatase